MTGIKGQYKCFEDNCIRFMEKECGTEREDGFCDKPDDYREYGDVIGAAKEAAEDEKYRG